MPTTYRLAAVAFLLIAAPVLALGAEGAGATGASSMGVNSAGTTATGPAANFGLNGGPAGGPRSAGRANPGVNSQAAVTQARRDAISGAAHASTPSTNGAK